MGSCSRGEKRVLSLDGVLRIVSAAMALAFSIFFSDPDIPLYTSIYFWICVAYVVFLMLKKNIYFWDIGSPLNLFIEAAELTFIIYIHNMSNSVLALIFYLSFMIRTSFLYSWKISIIIYMVSAIGNIMLNFKATNFTMDRNALFFIIYGIIFNTGTYVGSLAIANINRELLKQNQQLKEMLSIKEALIKELDESREQLRRNNEELAHIANTDGLTGLHNHKYFHEYLDNLFKYLEEHDDRISLVIMDLDRFKQYNDTYGHLEGDTVLQDLGKIILQCIGENDVAARYGGDEFAIILPGQGEEEAMKVVERIKEALDEYRHRNPRFLKVGVSIGVATNSFGIKTKEQLIKQADRNMYMQKNIE